MTARGTKIETRHVTDEEIVGWVVPERSEDPEDAARHAAELIINRRIQALKDIVSKLTFHA